VLLVQGGASLHFADQDEAVRLAPGDYVNIPAHARHRIESTDAGVDTVWLAVFY
jgi:cupin 2 domain-containing protein